MDTGSILVRCGALYRRQSHSLARGLSVRKHLLGVITLIRASMAQGHGLLIRASLQACGQFLLRNSFPAVLPLDQAV